MVKIEAGYMTGSGNHMSMLVHGCVYDIENVPVFDDVDMVAALCNAEKGCKGQNGGCPPYAPHFDKIKPSCDQFYVICVEFDMAWAIKYSGWWKGVSAPGLYILVYADRLTMNYMQRLLRVFEAEKHYTLGVSNCPGCRPKDCTVLLGEKCIKPRKRRYSVESTGVDCAEVHLDIFDSVLPWWHRTPTHMPTRMYRYAGVFGNGDAFEDNMDSLLEQAVVTDKYYAEHIAKTQALYVTEELHIPPSCYYPGQPYLAYRIPVERMEKK